jgi:hypothetical protein
VVGDHLFSSILFLFGRIKGKGKRPVLRPGDFLDSLSSLLSVDEADIMVEGEEYEFSDEQEVVFRAVEQAMVGCATALTIHAVSEVGTP